MFHPKKGDSILGTKVEIKNLNSIRNVKRAIDFGKLMTELADKNETIVQQTRSFDAVNEQPFPEFKRRGK
jgi:aspartyl-tRNA(Asn)/glutamyl-tRNA(Gln) amidotransferase subunit B